MTIGSSTRAGARLALAALLACGLLAAAAAPALAGTWLPSVDLSKPLRSANRPTVAMDDAGRTVAIWERDGKTPFESTVQASVRGLGGQFSEPLDLSLPSYAPQLAITPAGEAVATWWHSEGGKYVLQVSRRPPDGPFSPPLDVAEAPTSASPPETDLAVNAGGEAAVAWVQKNVEEKSAIMAATLPAGAAPSSAQEVSDPEHDAFSPDVDVAPDGTAVLAWAGYFSAESPSAVLLSTESGGSFPAPVKVSSADGVDSPQLALDAAGDPTLVWRGLVEKEVEPGEPELFFSAIEGRSAVGGSFGSVFVLLEDEEDPGFLPRLAIAPDGTAVAVWVHRELASSFALEGVTRPSSQASFSAPQEIAQEEGEISAPSLAINGGGTSIVAWHNASSVSRASIRPPGGPFGAPADLGGGQPALFPKVALDGAGDAVAVWRGTDGSNQIARASGYDANPPELRNLSVPAEGTVGRPVSLSVEPFDVWPLAAVGFAFGDGGSAAGASVTHAYGAPGSYPVTATATDSAGASAEASATIQILASNDFRLGRLKRNKRTGRATLIVHVPGPGRLSLRGTGLKKAVRRARAAGSVKLPVRAVGRAAKRLRGRGKTKVRLRVTFSPDGGRPATKARSAVLKKALRHRHRRQAG
jgi:hypothetical protein